MERFHLDSDATSRATVDGGGGAEDTTGSHWLIKDLWVQHVESSLWASGSDGTVEDNLFTVIFADGCNLNNVALTGTSGSHLTATNNFIRGTGDDGMAINSVDYNTNGTTKTFYTAMSDITISHNTVIAPWSGKGIGIYGGGGHRVDEQFHSRHRALYRSRHWPVRRQRKQHDRRYRIWQRHRQGGRQWLRSRAARPADRQWR